MTTGAADSLDGLKGRTLFVTGGSRGIGLAIALRAARDGANVAIAAKTVEPDQKLPGTIHSAARLIEAAGGRALAIPLDVRDASALAHAVATAADAFGGIDICVNNASAVSLASSLDIEVKRFDLMQSINTRGTFLTSRACVPYLRASSNPHILTLSPPLALRPDWFATHLPYTLSKYGMSMVMLGMAREFAADGIACNALWPRTLIATAAVKFAFGGADALRRSRNPEIVADAAHAIFRKPAREFTGRFVFDDEVLATEGIVDFSSYRNDETAGLRPDLFVDLSQAVPAGAELDIDPRPPAENKR